MGLGEISYSFRGDTVNSPIRMELFIHLFIRFHVLS